MVTSDGDVLLMDFGIAVDGRGSRRGRHRAAGGDLAYMSPEQLHTDTDSGDLYALGVMLLGSCRGGGKPKPTPRRLPSTSTCFSCPLTLVP